MNIYIYKLIDPVSKEIRYIGKTGNMKNRFSSHISNAKKSKSHLAHWLTKLRNKGLFPIMEIIEECNLDNWEEREIFWISSHTGTKKLCNTHSGGRLSCRDAINKSKANKYDVYNGKFRVRGSYLNTVYYIGEFKTREEAVTAYDNFYSCPLEWINQRPEKIGNFARQKRVFVYDKKEKLLLNQFESVSKCANYYSIDKSNIARCCRNKLKSCKNMIFSYNPL